MFDIAQAGRAEGQQRPLHGAANERVAVGRRRVDAVADLVLHQAPPLLEAVAVALPGGDGDVAAQPQNFEHDDHVVAAAPATGVGPGDGGPALDLLGIERPALGQFAEEGLLERPVGFLPVAHALPPHAAGHFPLVHVGPEEGVVVGQDDGGGVGPILEQGAVFPEQRVQMGRVIGAEAAEGYKQLCAGDDVDRVELQAGDAADGGEEVGFGGVRPRRLEVLGHDGQAAGVLGGEDERRDHSGRQNNRTCVLGQERACSCPGKLRARDNTIQVSCIIGVAMKKRKLLQRILANPQDVAFSDMVTLVMAFGFRLSRVNGSHHIFVHLEVRELVNLQNVNDKIKP